MINQEMLSRIGLFKDFTEDEIEEVSKACLEEYYPKGAVIFEENTLSDRLYFIISGQVKISHKLETAGEEELVVLDRNECFGEMSLIDGGERSATAVAEADTTLIAIKKEDIGLIMENNNSIAVKLLKHFCRILSARLRDANSQISEMTGLFVSFRAKR